MDYGKRIVGGLAAVLLLAAFPPMAEAGPWKYASPEREQNRQSDLQP